MKASHLGDHIDLLSGFAFKSANFAEVGGLPLIRIRDVKRGYSETSYLGDYNSKYIIENGDLLVGMDGEFSAARWRGGRALLNQRVCKIVAKATIDPSYLRHLLVLELKRIEDHTPFVTVKHLSAKKIRGISRPLPPLPEQRRIAGILDAADAIRRKRRAAVKQTDALLRSTFLEMFGDPVTNPKGWPLVDLGTIIAETQYGTSERANEEGNGLPVLRMNNLTYSGRIDLSQLKWVELPASELPKRTVSEGDLLFNRTNSPKLVGKTAVWHLQETMAIAGYLIRVRFRPEKALPDYVSGYLNSSHGKRYLAMRAKPSNNMSNFSASTLRRVPIRLPPTSLQQKFAECVAQAETLRTHLRAAAQESETLFNALVQKAFRGDL